MLWAAGGQVALRNLRNPGLDFLCGASQSHDKHYQHSDDLVRDARAFAKVLASRHYPGLKMRVQVFEGEDHQTVAPIVFTHGLLNALGSPQ